MPRPVHFEFPAENTERATKFFTDVFGWKFTSWGDGSYQLADTGTEEGGIHGAIMQRKDPNQPVTNSIMVDSIEEYGKKIEENGGHIVVPKQTVPTMGYLAYFKDTEGNIHGLWQNDPTAQ